MDVLRCVVEVMLCVFSSWTLAFYIIFAAKLPAASVIIPFLIIPGILTGFFFKTWKRAVSGFHRDDRKFLLGVLLLALVTGMFALVVSRPDADDVGYIQPMLSQLKHLDAPFFAEGFGLPGVGTVSWLDRGIPYESFVTMTDAVVKADPLSAFQNLGAFVPAFFLVIVYVLLYRQFGLGRTATLVATLLALLFMVIDGNLHRSFGNMMLVRIWQGKDILWTVLLPLLLLFSFQAIRRPTGRLLLLVTLVSIAALGLNRASLFLVPILVFGVSITYLLIFGLSGRHIRNALALNMAASLCTGIAVAAFISAYFSSLASGQFVQAAFQTESAAGQVMWPPNWWDNLMGLVIGTHAALLRDFLILVPLPFLASWRCLGP
jgi:Family of unknown function (DUF6077)